MTTTLTFLFAHGPKHTPRAHAGAMHQASIGASTLTAARREFERLYPDRVVITDGILGKS